jgi:hypothetical protein
MRAPQRCSSTGHCNFVNVQGPIGVQKKPRGSQSHGRNSKVYVPVIKRIFAAKYRDGMTKIDFTLDEVRDACGALGIVSRNPADVIYRMRARTKLPQEILDAGFFILRQVGRGMYRLEQATSTLIEIPDHVVHEALDLTPLPVRRLFPQVLAEIDEQGLLSVISYCKLMDHFTGLQVYRLRSHVRKSVAGIGQAELDEIDVGVAMRDDEMPVIFPIEAKAADESVNRVQIAAQVAFCLEYFPGYEIRPLAVKLDEESIVHFLEFNVSTTPADLTVKRSKGYRLKLSDQHAAFFAHSADGIALRAAAALRASE